MAEPHAHSQPIQTYGPAPHNRSIWPSPTPTANQYKHMAQRRIIETYGHTIAGRRSFVCASGRFFCLSWWLWSTHYFWFLLSLTGIFLLLPVLTPHLICALSN